MQAIIHTSNKHDSLSSNFVYLDFHSDLQIMYLLTPIILDSGKFMGEGQLIISKDELVHEKEKFKAISDELDQTFAEMSGY